MRQFNFITSLPARLWFFAIWPPGQIFHISSTNPILDEWRSSFKIDWGRHPFPNSKTDRTISVSWWLANFQFSAAAWLSFSKVKVIASNLVALHRPSFNKRYLRRMAISFKHVFDWSAYTNKNWSKIWTHIFYIRHQLRVSYMWRLSQMSFMFFLTAGEPS